MGSGSNSHPEPQPGGDPPTDWFDIDAFLDDYVNDLGNQDPLDQISLDFSLPFPAAKILHEPQGVYLPPPSTFPIIKPEADELLPAPTSESDQPSEPEKPRGRTPRSNARGRAATSKAEKAEPRSAAQQRKHQALQEKNRRAQRRFRERQKQRVEELEGQVQSLTAQLQSVVLERDILRQRNLELEAASLSNGNNLINYNTVADESPRNNNFFPRTSTNPAPISEACSDAGHSPVAACSEGMTLNPKIGGPEVILTPSDLCAMTQPVLSAHFGSLVKECARTFVEGSGMPGTEERMSQLVDQALTLWHRVAQCNPTAAKQFATIKLDDTSRGQPADERAPHIARSLGLSERQKSELSNLRKLFLQKISSIASNMALATGQTIHTNASSIPHGGTSGRLLAGHHLALRQASRQLAQSLLEEHSTFVEFENMVTRQVLAPSQAAQLLIQSFPWSPDCLALATWVAAEAGEADAVAALSAEAQARAATAAAAVAGKQNPSCDTSAAAAALALLNRNNTGHKIAAVPPPFSLGNAQTSSVNTTCLPSGSFQPTF